MQKSAALRKKTQLFEQKSAALRQKAQLLHSPALKNAAFVQLFVKKRSFGFVKHSLFAKKTQLLRSFEITTAQSCVNLRKNGPIPQAFLQLF